MINPILGMVLMEGSRSFEVRTGRHRRTWLLHPGPRVLQWRAKLRNGVAWSSNPGRWISPCVASWLHCRSAGSPPSTSEKRYGS